VVDGEQKSLTSQKAYRGVNQLLLSCSRFGSPYWLTFNQAKDLGGTVKKGEHGWPVVFYKEFKAEDDPGIQDGETNTKDRAHYMLRYYTVFNLSQCELPAKVMDAIAKHQPVKVESDPIASCEEIVTGWTQHPPIEHGKDGAWYSPSKDVIGMPDVDTFTSRPEYYSTLFHELAHSTGHASRLDRFEKEHNHTFGSADYSREELVAEITAAFLCGKAGIETSTLENSSAYCKAWITRLKGDSKLIVNSAGKAQKASDYILGKAV
jgi:antirestriction protein ArdC